MDWQWSINLFTILGIVVSVVILLIVFVWGICFGVKVITKTFGDQVKSSYALRKEDIEKKYNAKKERNERKREQLFAQKNEILDELNCPKSVLDFNCLVSDLPLYLQSTHETMEEMRSKIR